jgi:hypothetical protein
VRKPLLRVCGGVDRPPNSRLARVAVIVFVLAALIWLVSFVGINLSGKQTSDR